MKKFLRRMSLGFWGCALLAGTALIIVGSLSLVLEIFGPPGIAVFAVIYGVGLALDSA
jgi:hypothetical protein